MQTLIENLDEKQKMIYEKIKKYHEDKLAWDKDASQRAKENQERLNEQRQREALQRKKEKEEKLREMKERLERQRKQKEEELAARI